MKIKVCLVLLTAFAIQFSAHGEDKPAAVTFTAGTLHLCLDDVYFTQKKGYVHVLFDIYPYASQIKASHLTGLSTVAQALLSDQGLKKYAREKNFKIDVVEILGRDDYGAPRWDQVKLKESYLGETRGKEVVLVEKKAAK